MRIGNNGEAIDATRELVDAIAAVVVESGPAAPRATAAAAPPAPSRLDWDAALETVDGDRELLGKVIDGFLGQQPALVAELREALGAGDLPVVKEQLMHFEWTMETALRRGADLAQYGAALTVRLEDGAHVAEPEPVPSETGALPLVVFRA